LKRTEAFEFENKVALVTGASRGIGLQIVKHFAAEGAKVIMVAASEENLINGKNSIHDGNENVSYIRCDLSDYKDIEAMVSNAVKAHGKIDILVNNAGAFSEKAPWNEISHERWHQTFDLNTLAVYHCMKYVAEHMVQNNIKGAMVNIGSSSALHLKAGRLNYTVSKTAVHSMSQVVALDLARQGIRVNIVSPGPTATETVQKRIDDAVQSKDEEIRLRKIPLGRYASTSDIANAVLFLSSDRAAFITGAVLPVDGGYTIGETI